MRAGAHAAAPATILVKFKQPAGAAAKLISALGDNPVGQTATRVSIVRLSPGEPPPLPPPQPPPPVLPLPKPPDTVRPFVRAYPVTGRRGRTVKLTYRVCVVS